MPEPMQPQPSLRETLLRMPATIRGETPQPVAQMPPPKVAQNQTPKTLAELLTMRGLASMGRKLVTQSPAKNLSGAMDWMLGYDPSLKPMNNAGK